MDEEGLPKEARRRLGIAKKTVATAEGYGIPPEEVIIDPLAMAAGLTCVIVDALDVEIRKTIAACNLLMGRDEHAMRFLACSRAGW